MLPHQYRFVNSRLVHFERDEETGGWFVEVPELPGCHSHGENIPEATARIQEAMSLFIESGAARLA